MPTATTLITIGGIVVILLLGYAVGRHGPPPSRRRGRVRLAEMRAAMDRAITPFGAFIVLASAVMTLATGIMWIVGVIVRQLQAFDSAAYHWIEPRQPVSLTSLQEVVTQIGNKQECWIVGAVVAVVYLLAARRRRWAGALLIATVIVLQHYQQVVLTDMIHRGHPPGSGGTFPSGGATRVLAIYGVCMFALLRLLPASRRLAAAGWALIAVLAFLQGWSGLYLSLHWTTDVLSGWLSGLLLLGGLAYAGASIVTGRRTGRRPRAADSVGVADAGKRSAERVRGVAAS